jgi:hypothetical protein
MRTLEDIFNNKEIKDQTICPYCGSKKSAAKYSCTPECRDNFFEKLGVVVSKRFAKHCLSLEDQVSQIEEVKQYAMRHNFDYELTVRKFIVLACDELKKEPAVEVIHA